MWIMSQNRDQLIEVNNLRVHGDIIMCGTWELGRYESNDRAMQVLQQIKCWRNANKTMIPEMPII